MSQKKQTQYEQKTLRIKGMDCVDCVNIIEHALSHLKGILSAKVGYASQQLRIEFDNKQITLARIVKLLKRMGYTITETHHSETWFHEWGELGLSVLSGLFLLIGWITGHTWFAILAYGCAGFMTARDSIQTLLQKRFDIDVLMVFAAIGAGILGAWFEGGLLLFLFSLGHALEHRAMHHTQHAIEKISELAPHKAMVKKDNELNQVLVEDIIIGDHIIVYPHQRIPLDGIVVEGESDVNQATVTGESVPIDKSLNDKVYSGTMNGEGTLVIQVTRLAADSTLNRMVQMVLEADTRKSQTERWTSRFVKIFVPTILVVVVGLIFIPLFFGVPWQIAFYRAMAVLVAASPCALAISTPSAVLAAVANAARHGILIKGGIHLENLGIINAVAFDKTGTLTLGKISIQSIKPINTTEHHLLQLAASLEQHSNHPLANAIVKAAEEKNLPLKHVTDVKSFSGKGMHGIYENQSLVAGNYKLFDVIPEDIQFIINTLQEKGNSLVIVKHGEKWLGVIGLSDTIRPQTKEAILELNKIGIHHTIMVTGDNHLVANNIAQQTNISEVFSDLMPEDKLNIISALEEKYDHIAMVGDGVNDAPAMARARVGIGMGGAGSDIALEASDVALMADDLSMLPYAIKLSRRALKTIKQNLWISLSVVVVLLICTLSGIVGIGPAIILHEGSTLLVLLNALRLLK